VVAATDMEDRVEALIQRGMDVVKKQVQLCVHGQKTIRIALTDAGSQDPFGRLIDDSCGVFGAKGRLRLFRATSRVVVPMDACDHAG
jgi:hypothetical protein